MVTHAKMNVILVSENMEIVITQEAARYIIWQRTKYTKDLILHRLARFINQFSPLLTRPCYWLLAARRRGYIAKHFSADMQIDYNSIADYLPPSASDILDIGAGVSGIGVFLSQHYQHTCTLHLLDKSSIARTIYYGFEPETAFYNSLTVARELLARNQVPMDNVITYEVGDEAHNPFSDQTYDLITSFISWGYHYPLSTYLSEVTQALKPGGVLIVDLRVDGDEYQVLMNTFSQVEVIYQTPYLRRVRAMQKS